MAVLNTAALTHLTPNNGKTHTVIKRPTAYQKEPKNSKALTIVKNWLESADIPVQASAVQGCDLAIKKADGGLLEIKVGISPDDSRPAAEHLFVLASELAHRSKPIATAAFQRITEAAGHGKAEVFTRGIDPGKKLSFEDNFELVAMRHREFRKVPNSVAAELPLYDKVISKAVSRFLYINTKICRRHGLDFDDLKTYAQVWACNYLGLYKVANPTNNDNERKMYAHLCQRFGNFVEVLLKKERSCIPDPQTTSVALLGKPYEGPNHGSGRRVFQQERDASEASFDEALEADLEAEVDCEVADLMTFDPEASELTTAQEEEQEQKLNDAKRRKAAKDALAQEFARLPHERLMYLLEEAAVNPALCPDARSEAQKQLRLHRKVCASCKAKEQASGADALSAA